MEARQGNYFWKNGHTRQAVSRLVMDAGSSSLPLSGEGAEMKVSGGILPTGVISLDAGWQGEWSSFP